MEEASEEVEALVANVACVAVDKPAVVEAWVEARYVPLDDAPVVEPAVEPVVLLADDSCSVDEDVVDTDELGTAKIDDVDVEYGDDTACGLAEGCSSVAGKLPLPLSAALACTEAAAVVESCSVVATACALVASSPDPPWLDSMPVSVVAPPVDTVLPGKVMDAPGVAIVLIEEAKNRG